MPRSRYWKQSYLPNADDPVDQATLDAILLPNGGVLGKAVINQPAGSFSSAKLRISDPRRRIENCDFKVSVTESQIANIHFLRCRFISGEWKRTKFSDCMFEHCDFEGVNFEDCYFLSGCKFKNNSASAELFKLNRTAIPPGAFLNSLYPNLDYLPDDVTKNYQLYRFLGTKVKVAKLVWSSNQDEAELDYYFEAHAELMLCVLNAKIEGCFYKESSDGNERHWYLIAWLRGIPWRFECVMVRASGFITKWGRSVLRPCIAFFIISAIFAMVWFLALRYFNQPHSVLSCIGRAINLTLAVGYGVHIDGHTLPALKALAIVNVVLGLWWYSLIVPVILKRTIR